MISSIPQIKPERGVDPGVLLRRAVGSRTAHPARAMISPTRATTGSSPVIHGAGDRELRDRQPGDHRDEQRCRDQTHPADPGRATAIARDGEGGEPGTLADHRRDDRADVQPVPGVDAADVRRRHERRIPDPAARHHPFRPVDQQRHRQARQHHPQPSSPGPRRPRSEATATAPRSPPSRHQVLLHARRQPEQRRSQPQPTSRVHRSPSSTSTHSPALQRHPRHVGPDGERLARRGPARPRPGAPTTTPPAAAVLPAGPAGRPPSIVATRPATEISRPASRAASTGCRPARAIGQASSAAAR